MGTGVGAWLREPPQSAGLDAATLRRPEEAPPAAAKTARGVPSKPCDRSLALARAPFRRPRARWVRQRIFPSPSGSGRWGARKYSRATGIGGRLAMVQSAARWGVRVRLRWVLARSALAACNPVGCHQPDHPRRTHPRALAITRCVDCGEPAPDAAMRRPSPQAYGAGAPQDSRIKIVRRAPVASPRSTPPIVIGCRPAPQRERMRNAMAAPPDLSRCERCGRSLPPATHPSFSQWTTAKDDAGKVSGMRCPSCQAGHEADD